jgi:hypothetical protein
MALAFSGHFVEPLEPEDLRQRLVDDIPRLYAAYRDYWQALGREMQLLQDQCPHLYRELRYGTLRGLIHPL